LWIGAYSGGGGGPLVAEETYTVDGSGNLVSEVDGLTVNAGSEYTFVAYSYNSSTELPAYSATIPGIDPSNTDLLWGQTTVTVTGSSNVIPLTLHYMFPKLTVALEATDLDGSTALSLSGISNVTVTPDSLANLEVAGGTLTGSAKATPSSIGGWPTAPALTVTSSSITLYTGRTNTVTIHIGSITIGNNQLTLAPTFTFARPLEHDSYKLTIRLKKALARFINLELAPIAPRTDADAFANEMRYSYSDPWFVTTVPSLQTAAKQAATQGTYTIDRGGNTAVTAIRLIATYSVPGDYHFRVNLGVGGDSIVYSDWGRLPAIPAGQSTGTYTISLTPFRKDADGNELDINGQPAASSGLSPALNAWENGVLKNDLPSTIPTGKRSDIIRFYTTADDPGGSPTGRLEVPIWFGYRTMKVVSWGQNSEHTLNGATGEGYRMLNEDNNFGYNGITPVGGMDIVRKTSDLNSDQFLTEIKDADVLLIQYNLYPNNDIKRRYLKSFIDRGGAVMLNCESADNLRNILNTIYGHTFTSGNGSTGYIFGTIPDSNSKILNGPFNQFLQPGETIAAVGEDNSGESLTKSSVDQISGVEIIAMRNANNVFVFFDPSKALLVTGDASFLSSTAGNRDGGVSADSNNRPQSKAYNTLNRYPSTLTIDRVYNAFVFCNYLDFAVKYVAVNRNHTNDNDDSTW
jgi:hypothetical protein